MSDCACVYIGGATTKMVRGTDLATTTRERDSNHGKQCAAIHCIASSTYLIKFVIAQSQGVESGEIQNGRIDNAAKEGEVDSSGNGVSRVQFDGKGRVGHSFGLQLFHETYHAREGSVLDADARAVDGQREKRIQTGARHVEGQFVNVAVVVVDMNDGDGRGNGSRSRKSGGGE